MYHSQFPSTFEGFRVDDGSDTLTYSDDSNETLLTADHARSQEAVKKSGWRSANSLGFASLILHAGLVAIHLALVGVWAKRLEYSIAFSLDHQTIISFAVTAAATSFGVSYSALLVFLTQGLSMRRSLRTRQTLTETHDIASAWGGIGASILCIWNQRKVTSSIGAVLSVFCYLGCILVLHVTTPALFSTETFNATRSTQVETRGLPAYAWPSNPSHDVNGESLLDKVILDTLVDYAVGSLAFFPSVVESAVAPGLSGGTLYDTLDFDTLTGIGNVTVDATGFNISCGYLNDVVFTYNSSFAVWQTQVGEGNSSVNYSVPSTPRGLISSLPLTWFNWPQTRFYRSLLVYSTIPIVDSNVKSGPSTKLVPPMDTSVSSVYLLQCSQVLVNQTAVVDVQSQKIIIVSPSIEKTVSSWAPFPGPEDGQVDADGVPLFIDSSDGNLFLDAWGHWYNYLPIGPVKTEWPRAFRAYGVADLCLVQKLNLFPTDGGLPRESVTLHELENALSVIVASMFWTLGHQPPAAPGLVNLSYVNGSLVRYPDLDLISPGPFLLKGTVVVAASFPQGRLSSSIIAISTGLAASIALMLLSLQYFPSCMTMADDEYVPTGIMTLHVTAPALVSMETFNSTSSIMVVTQGLPTYGNVSLHDGESTLDVVGDKLSAYIPGPLAFFPTIVQNADQLGLSGGTLYEVFDLNSGEGNATVDATGFNISCGYLTDVVQKHNFSDSGWHELDIQVGKGNSSAVFEIDDMPPRFIWSMDQPFFKSIVLTSTIPIIDSENKLGPATLLEPLMHNKSVPSVQMLRCSLSLVNQKATVDAQSRRIIAVEPNIEKTVSSWLPFTEPEDGPRDNYGMPLFGNSTSQNLLLDIWGWVYDMLPGASTYSQDITYSSQDLFLLQKLDLMSMNALGPLRANVTLYEVENALSVIVASMFWTLGHKLPGTPLSINISEVNGSLVRYPDSNQTLPEELLGVNGTGPVLLNGTATVTQMILHGHLNLNIIAVSVGFAASLVLLLLSLFLAAKDNSDADLDTNVTIEGTGMLHAIWLYRNHPELETLLEQIEHPTTHNLRKAGMTLMIKKLRSNLEVTDSFCMFST
ncbi:hypothetical protein B0H19DRAFT_1374294 [Mycena capillaripes]|nr:hypothetical protein B0H19DRAFT_1374294 [Mycena capillaripes]